MSKYEKSSRLDTKIPRFSVDQKAMINSAIWVSAAIIVGLITFFNTICFGRIKGDEVGVMLNRLTGKTTVVEQSGVKIYCGLTNKLYILDKVLQTLEMVSLSDDGDRKGKDDLKIKTVDGSDVFVDVKAQFEIIPSMADVVLATSGLNDAYKEKWARDYSRSQLRMYLGELKTEEVYDAQLRDTKVQAAKKIIDVNLAPWGLRIDALVIPKKPHFYDEYEAKIQEKKLADQSVLEETSMASAAQEKQTTEVMTASNRMNVAVKAFEGEIEQQILAAEAEAETTMKGADAYYTKMTVGAEALLYQKEREAQGTLAEKLAEAEGIKKMREALEGNGGFRMVQLEYAKRFADMSFDAQPFSYEGETSRISLSGDMISGSK